MTDTTRADLTALAEFYERQCAGIINGRCSTRACLVRSGWKSGDPVDYSKATCREKETAAVLRAVGPVREALQDFVDKCDRGEARSVRSYAKFKAALSLLDKIGDGT